MNSNLRDKKVLLTGGRQDAACAIGEASSEGLIDVVIWIRELTGASEQRNILDKAEVRVASAKPNEELPRASLWRETMGY